MHSSIDSNEAGFDVTPFSSVSMTPHKHCKEDSEIEKRSLESKLDKIVTSFEFLRTNFVRIVWEKGVKKISYSQNDSEKNKA